MADHPLGPLTHGTAANGDCEVYYETFGDRGDPALLLINGLGSQCINYREAWCEMFAAEHLHVIRFDNRDVGWSTCSPAHRSTTRARRTACPTWRPTPSPCSTRSVSSGPTCMGLSMGGMIVQTLAIEHPDRLRSLTSVMSTHRRARLRGADAEALAALLAPPADRPRVSTSPRTSPACGSGAARRSPTRSAGAPTPNGPSTGLRPDRATRQMHGRPRRRRAADGCAPSMCRRS